MKLDKLIARHLYWHAYHDRLVDYLRYPKRRTVVINRHKPRYQIAERLRMFQPVKGRLPRELVLALNRLHKTTKAMGEHHSSGTSHARIMASQAFHRAEDEYMPAIKALHDTECKNCIWDGRKIDFSRDVE